MPTFSCKASAFFMETERLFFRLYQDEDKAKFTALFTGEAIAAINPFFRTEMSPHR
jgi:hypothetical protein